MDFTTHVCQNLSRDSFRVLSTITSLRELTLSNSSTVSSTGGHQILAALATLGAADTIGSADCFQSRWPTSACLCKELPGRLSRYGGRHLT